MFLQHWPGSGCLDTFLELGFLVWFFLIWRNIFIMILGFFYIGKWSTSLLCKWRTFTVNQSFLSNIYSFLWKFLLIKFMLQLWILIFNLFKIALDHLYQISISRNFNIRIGLEIFPILILNHFCHLIHGINLFNELFLSILFIIQSILPLPIVWWFLNLFLSSLPSLIIFTLHLSTLTLYIIIHHCQTKNKLWFHGFLKSFWFFLIFSYLRWYPTSFLRTFSGNKLFCFIKITL